MEFSCENLELMKQCVYGFTPQRIGQTSGTHIFLSESELEDLCTACGLVRFTYVRNGFFVMISAAKPS